MEARTRENGLLVALFVVIVLQASVGLALITTKNDLQATVSCQSAYNQQFSLAYRARVHAAANSREKLNNVMFFVFEHQSTKPPQGVERKQLTMQFKSILADYVQAEKNFKKQPLPPLPNSFCDRF